MISREAVSARLADQGLSFTEFSYQVLQANDYLELNRRFGCSLQIGGSDQSGNITAGCDLIRRVTGVRAHCLTLPLVTKADGTKFGKTAGGAVWLDPAMTTPYAFYQFWLNTEDRDVIRFLKIFSFRSREEIEDLEEGVRADPKSRKAQHVLANDFTDLVHGSERLAEVTAASESLFGKGDITKVSQDVMKSALPRSALH
jgi:tyrosyl-tRNA synthetase